MQQDLDESQYLVCGHCGRLLHRSTVWRHLYGPAQVQSLADALNLPLDLPLQSPPPSPDHVSLTSTERALSPLGHGELDDAGMDVDPSETINPPTPGQHAAPNHPPSPTPPPFPSAARSDVQPDPDIGDNPAASTHEALYMDGDPAVTQAHTAEQPFIEEPDLDIMNSAAPPPLLPTADEIFERARFGISETEEEDGDLFTDLRDAGLYNFEDDGIDLDDILQDSLNEIDEEVELNAARARAYRSSRLSEYGLISPLAGFSKVSNTEYLKTRLSGRPSRPSSCKWRSISVTMHTKSFAIPSKNLTSLLSKFSAAMFEISPRSRQSPIIAAPTHAYANRQACHHCHAPRFKDNGAPAKLFHYIPIVPQIQALYAGRNSAAQMRYRSDHHDDNLEDEDGTISDVYDSELYKVLRESNVIINRQIHPFKYFDDPRDVFLTGMTDGFQLFKKGKQTAWPLLFVNNNLAPSLRYKQSNAICVGLIPGPRKPKEHDSFMYVVVEDLAKAAVGTPAYDAFEDEMFTLRVFCPLKCGDMPAMASAYTGGKHHGAQHPCRACPIEGIRILDSNNLSHYLPLIRPPGYPEQPYTLTSLPLRTHSEYLRQAKEVDEAPTQVERRRLSQLYGINHTPIVSQIPGIMFPLSFPFEFMHLLENTIENYVTWISGNFKALGDGVESFTIAEPVWKEIGIATVKANATIPSSFGRRIPNIAEDRTYFTAEGYIVWATLYAPILLRGRFRNDRYYRHWMKFISIIERCMQFAITVEEMDTLRADIHEWYTEYER